MLRLKEIRESKKISQQRLATDLNVSRSTIAMWETGGSQPDINNLKKLSEYFNTSADYILGNDNPTTSSGVKIPVLGSIQAGLPIEAIEEILDYEEITPEMASQGEYFALKIKGKSMEPKFSEGDVVVVRKQSDVDTGDIAIVLVNGDEATIKKIKKGPDGIMLIPSNPNFEVMFYSNEEIENKPVVILGKVVELRAKF